MDSVNSKFHKFQRNPFLLIEKEKNIFDKSNIGHPIKEGFYSSNLSETKDSKWRVDRMHDKILDDDLLGWLRSALDVTVRIWIAPLSQH